MTDEEYVEVWKLDNQELFELLEKKLGNMTASAISAYIDAKIRDHEEWNEDD